MACRVHYTQRRQIIRRTGAGYLVSLCVHSVANNLMTSCNVNIFRVPGPLWGKSTYNRRSPLAQNQWRGHLMFSLMSTWTNDWTNSGVKVIWDVIILMWRHSNWFCRIFCLSHLNQNYNLTQSLGTSTVNNWNVVNAFLLRNSFKQFYFNPISYGGLYVALPTVDT